MSWIFHSFVSAAFQGGRTVFDKHLLSNEAVPPIILGFLAFTVAWVLTLPIAYYFGEFSALQNTVFLQATMVNVVLNALAILLYFKILSKHDASLFTGIQTIEPLFVIVTGFVFVGETISMFGFLGILVVVMGALLLQKSRSQEDMAALLRHSPWIGVFIYMSMTSTATAFSKMALLNGGVWMYIGGRYVVLSLIFGVLALWWLHKNKGVYRFKLNHLASGFMLTGAVIFEMLALQAYKIAYVEALRRTTIFFALIFESLFLHKSWNIKRLLACTVLFAGTVLIIIYG